MSRARRKNSSKCFSRLKISFVKIFYFFRQKNGPKMKVTVCNSSYKKTKSKEKPNRYGFNFSMLISIILAAIGL